MLAKIEAALDAGKPALTVELTPEERAIARAVLPALRQADDLRLQRQGSGPRRPPTPTRTCMKVRDYVKTHLACEAVVISAQIESDLVDLAPDEADAFLKELGVAGERHRRADPRRPITCSACRPTSPPARRKCAPGRSTSATPRRKAAGVIHSDFERGFIKAETVAYDDLVACGSVAAAREKGLYRMEGKEYVVADGDVLLFKFNV